MSIKTNKNKYFWLYALVISTIGLAVFAVQIPEKVTISSATLYFSAIAGYGGIMLLLWNLVLGARSVVSIFGDDYTALMKIHRLVAKYGTLLIFAHPILVMISYNEFLQFVFLPAYGSQFENAITLGRAAFWLILVVWISSALVRGQMVRRYWKWLHFGAYVAVPFALLHIPDTGTNYANYAPAKIYFFIVVAGFAVFAIIRLWGALNFNKYRYRIISQQEISPGVYILKMSPKGGKKLIPKPGQFIFLKTGWLSEDHPFSIFDYDQQSGDLTIGYKVYGYYTENLRKLNPGSRLFASGPFGHFTDDITSEPSVFIAGGIGITPFIWRLMHEQNNREQWLFYANKTPQSAAFENMLKQRLGTKMISVYSSVDKPEHGCETGHICGSLVSKYLNDPKKFKYYVCGPGPMMQDVKKDLILLGIDKSDIFTESFSI